MHHNPVPQPQPVVLSPLCARLTFHFDHVLEWSSAPYSELAGAQKHGAGVGVFTQMPGHLQLIVDPELL
jgi:hypothetical protein